MRSAVLEGVAPRTPLSGHTTEATMLVAEVKVERDAETVWMYFTEPANWAKWWGGGLKSADWRLGGNLVWEVGGTAPIAALVPRRKIQITGPWMDTVFTFNEGRGGTTVVKQTDGLHR